MLKELEIKDFALIERLKIPWTSGLNVLTGETGAGKSIIIDALNVVLGGKVGAQAIRPGSDKAVIEASFADEPHVAVWLTEQGLKGDDLEEVVVSREITRSGSKVRINGTLVNATTVQELRQRLLTIHAQHEARTLLSGQSQLEMLDALGDPSHKKLLSEVKMLYTRRRELLCKLQEIDVSEDERMRRLDFAQFQLRELEEAGLSAPDEYERLTDQARVLGNVAQLETAAASAQAYLEGVDQESTACVDLLQSALVELDKALQTDAQLSPFAEALRLSLVHVEEVIRGLRRYREQLETDPEQLSQVESRLALLATIRRKYGPELASAIARKEELTEEINLLENAMTRSRELDSDFAKLNRELERASGALSKKRGQLSLMLANRIKSELSDLGMEHCEFKIAVEAIPPKGGSQSDDDGAKSLTIGPSGWDRVEFLISANPGQALLPISKIASGGELSRVMLAIKSIFAESDKVGTVVFDEIDAGLSGKILQSMKDKLARIAQSLQILCITHQPIIASSADNHIQVNKNQSNEVTAVTAQVLNADERVKSLASMASGQDGEESALRFAQSLFEQAARLRGS